MPLIEQPIRNEQLNLINENSSICQKSFKLDFENNSSIEIVTFICEMVQEFRSQKITGQIARKNISSPMGALWGETLVKEFNWEWIEIINPEQNNIVKVAVTNRNRSLVIYPINYIQECLDLGIDCKIILTFNMLSDKTHDCNKVADNSYRDLLHSTMRVIPLI